MAELTQRKTAGVVAVGDIDACDSEAANGRVHALEFDIRPSCAHEPPLRYVQKGESIALITAGRASAAAEAFAVDHTHFMYRYLQCLSPRFIQRELKEMFLPAGYPDSVSEDYLTFQFWDTIQAMCSYLRGVLATQSVLESVGVGDDKATPLAAAVQWVLRDGSGMIGGLIFAYLVGPKFDVNVKRWRLFADVANDAGLSFEMLAPHFPSLVTEVLCLSSICRTMCSVAAGATRSSLMTHFAKRDNMADCTAKEGSQETAVRLLGLIFGMYFANAVNSSRQSVWMAFVFLTIVHVYANYNAVSGLCIPTLNRQRAWILIDRYLHHVDEGKAMAGPEVDSSTKSMGVGQFSVRSVNQCEPIFSDPAVPIHRVVMGSQLYRITQSPHELEELLQVYADETFFLAVQDNTVHVVFQAEAKPIDELRAFFQTVLILNAGNFSDQGHKAKLELLQSTYMRMCAEFPSFFQVIQSHGWRTHMFLLNTTQWRIKLQGRC